MPAPILVAEGPSFASVRAPDLLRDLIAEIAAARPGDSYAPHENHATLAMAGPRQALATWRLLPQWLESAGATREDAWQQRRLVLRLYDVTLVDFDGFNAHRVVDFPLESLAGECLFGLDAAGRVELAEVGFLLPNGEFVPGARSQAVAFPTGAVAAEYDPSALFVDSHLRPEPVPTPWESGRWLKHRAAAALREHLRIALHSFESTAVGDTGASAVFVGELARGLATKGHEVHVVVPRRLDLAESRSIDGVVYHPVELGPARDPIELSDTFGRAAAARLAELGHFDLRHHHEWMAGTPQGKNGTPRVLSLSSTETLRIGGRPSTELSQRIQRAEQAVAQGANCVLVPEHLRSQALRDLGLSDTQIVAFPFEGRVLDEWESPLDLGRVRVELGLGPLDRMYLFVGPLEWNNGPDLLLEALPTLLGRYSNCRLVFVGLGSLQGQLENRARELGVPHAVRWLGHVEGSPLVRALRAAEAVVLPSRQRENSDAGVVQLARRAGRPVITTHNGPSQLVVHEQNGLVTYDNPGSMVWALSQFLSDSEHATLLGTMGRAVESRRPDWADLVSTYTALCAELFPQLAIPAA